MAGSDFLESTSFFIAAEASTSRSDSRSFSTFSTCLVSGVFSGVGLRSGLPAVGFGVGLLSGTEMQEKRAGEEGCQDGGAKEAHGRSPGGRNRAGMICRIRRLTQG